MRVAGICKLIWYIHGYVKEVYNYVGERIMYLSFAFDIVGLKFKKLDDVSLFNNLL